jgi:hypothetical protein
VHLPQFSTSSTTFLHVPSQHWLPVGQVMRQSPHAAGSRVRSRHVPSQSVSPAGQTQTPLWQILPPVQTFPQPPQFWASVVRFVHVSAHTLGRCGGQTHTPPWQIRRPAHIVPQLPQCRGSVARLRQMPPQSVSADGQTQTPLWQVLPPVQTFPQPPQLAESLAMLRHAPLQHSSPTAQATPQAPQLRASEVSLVHTPPQLVCEVGQQMPPGVPGEHVSFVRQPNSAWQSATVSSRHRRGSRSPLQNWEAATTQSPRSCLSQGRGPQVPLTQPAVPQPAPHRPQLAGSVLRSVHVPEQLVVPGGQMQLPLMHVAPAAQTFRQAPQFAGSPARLRQTLLQQVAPGAHAIPQAPQCCGSDATALHDPLQHRRASAHPNSS